MNEVLVTRALVKRYGRRLALNGFSLSIPRGATMGLVGRNGAGKTTWMMSVAGFVFPTSGEIDILGLGPFDAARHAGRISILPQDSELPLEARPYELLVGYGRLQGLSRQAAHDSATSLLEALNLADRAQTSIRTLSHGMRKRVMVAQAFLGHPEIVLLDEPLSGLDPVEMDRLRTFIRSRRGKQTVLISSHHLDDVEKLCTHVAFIANGKIEHTASLASLTSASGRVAYQLRYPPELASLASRAEDLSFTWQEATSTLVVEFRTTEPPETINARLIPELLPHGLISVTAGRTLEQAYLKGKLS